MTVNAPSAWLSTWPRRSVAYTAPAEGCQQVFRPPHGPLLGAMTGQGDLYGVEGCAVDDGGMGILGDDPVFLGLLARALELRRGLAPINQGTTVGRIAKDTSERLP